MDLQFYNSLFKTMLLALIAYGGTFGFLFLIFASSTYGINKKEWLFISLFPLLIMTIALLIRGIALTGGV